MPGQTIAEKIFSVHSDRFVKAGEAVVAKIDVAMATDGSGPLTLEFFKKMGGSKVFDSTKVLMVLDHYVPCPNDKVSRLQDGMRKFQAEGYCTLFEIGDGICHQLLPEKGYVKPGYLIVGGDSHSTTYGAFNALGTGIGSSDLAAAMISGKLWFRVPKTFKIKLTGKLRTGVSAKDIALYLVGKLGGGGAIYKALEFAGDGLNGISISERMTICNMMVETGAKCALMPGDEVTKSYFGCEAVGLINADADAIYECEIEVSLDELPPMVALPHQVDKVASITEIIGTPIQMGVIGTCTNGRIDDLRQALDLIGDKQIAPGFELLIVPASRQIYREASAQGILGAFVAKGATILPPGCGPCCGSSPGIPSDGENVFSTANRNFIGRMGNIRSAIYLGSPASVAAAAVTGRITDPRGIIW
jgi:3-isopropylmalate/(R)-2-methylmalate dehydratase large subunit